jgi:hypothetical protein
MNRDQVAGDHRIEPSAKTLSVPDAGRVYFGLSRGASYEAARRGELPVIRIGRLLRVPVIALEHMLLAAAHKQPVSDEPIDTVRIRGK